MAQEQKLTPKKVLIIELVDRSPSGFILEGSTQQGQPIHLDAPAWRRIPSVSVVRDGEGFRRIRHIQGAPSIFVDEQDKAGYKYNATRDNIVLKGPVNTIVRDGRDICKYDYLAACEYNLHAPGLPGNENVIFKEIRSQEVAKADIGTLKLKERAHDIIKTLYTETPDGSYVYEGERMKVIARTLGINDQPSDEEMLMAIAGVAEKNPQFFLGTIADKTVEYKSDIQEAIHLGVLSMDGGGASLRSAGQVFLKLRKKNREEQTHELVMHYLSPDGAMDYKNLRSDLEIARQKLAEVV